LFKIGFDVASDQLHARTDFHLPARRRIGAAAVTEPNEATRVTLHKHEIAKRLLRGRRPTFQFAG
jgi:hypothetical protein